MDQETLFRSIVARFMVDHRVPTESMMDLILCMESRLTESQIVDFGPWFFRRYTRSESTDLAFAYRCYMETMLVLLLNG